METGADKPKEATSSDDAATAAAAVSKADVTQVGSNDVVLTIQS